MTKTFDKKTWQREYMRKYRTPPEQCVSCTIFKTHCNGMNRVKACPLIEQEPTKEELRAYKDKEFNAAIRNSELSEEIRTIYVSSDTYIDLLRRRTDEEEEEWIANKDGPESVTHNFDALINRMMRGDVMQCDFDSERVTVSRENHIRIQHLRKNTKESIDAVITRLLDCYEATIKESSLEKK